MNSIGRARIDPMIIAFCVGLLSICVILQPGAALVGATMALDVWWRVILPVLLPLGVLCEWASTQGVLFLLSKKIFTITGKRLGWTWRETLAVVYRFCYGPLHIARSTEIISIPILRADAWVFATLPHPFLILISVSYGIWQSPIWGWSILIALWTAASLIAVVCRTAGLSSDHEPSFQTIIRTPKPFGQLLADGVTLGLDGAFRYAGWLMFGAVAANVLSLSSHTLQLLLLAAFDPILFVMAYPQPPNSLTMFLFVTAIFACGGLSTWIGPRSVQHHFNVRQLLLVQLMLCSTVISISILGWFILN